MKPKLIYVSDAYCVWCFAFAPSVNAIVSKYEDEIDIEVLNGRMVGGGATVGQFFSRFPSPMALHHRVEEYSGRRFGQAYINQLNLGVVSTVPMDSEIPARAMLAMEKCKPGCKLQALQAIHDIFYTDGVDLVDLQTYKPICETLGLDFETFLETYRSTATKDALGQERQRVARLGVSGFPSLFLQSPSGELVALARGFVPASQLRPSFEAALQSMTTASAQAVGMVCDPSRPGSC